MPLISRSALRLSGRERTNLARRNNPTLAKMFESPEGMLTQPTKRHRTVMEQWRDFASEQQQYANLGTEIVFGMGAIPAEAIEDFLLYLATSQNVSKDTLAQYLHTLKACFKRYAGIHVSGAVNNQLGASYDPRSYRCARASVRTPGLSRPSAKWTWWCAGHRPPTLLRVLTSGDDKNDSKGKVMTMTMLSRCVTSSISPSGVDRPIPQSPSKKEDTDGDNTTLREDDRTTAEETVKRRWHLADAEASAQKKRPGPVYPLRFLLLRANLDMHPALINTSVRLILVPSRSPNPCLIVQGNLPDLTTPLLQRTTRIRLFGGSRWGEVGVVSHAQS
ncbi:hypothetical protein C8R45DRAFT_1105237 [Mycena sanguinolenta]|nr:hypothetical protein C8R45DRAFT_1105237 [Mycena sanguinolenta]